MRFSILLEAHQGIAIKRGDIAIYVVRKLCHSEKQTVYVVCTMRKGIVVLMRVRERACGAFSGNWVSHAEIECVSNKRVCTHTHRD